MGSGKTTFLIEVAKELNSRGLKVATIVNDVGHINVDRKCMEVHGIDTMEISGGCICCEVQGTLTTTVTNIYMSYKPDVILVEPTGVAIPLGLKQAAAETVKKMPKVLEQSPIVTFVDAMRIDKLMNNVRRLVETQIIEADAVLINKVDAVSEERLRSRDGDGEGPQSGGPIVLRILADRTGHQGGGRPDGAWKGRGHLRPHGRRGTLRQEVRGVTEWT